MRNALKIETKSADNEDTIADVKTALEGLTSDVEKKTAPVADLAKRLDAIEANDNREADEDVEAKALNQFLRDGQVDAEVKTLTVGTATAGGYVTAPEYSATVIKKLTELSPMRRLASVMSIGAGEIYIPTLESDAEGGWVTETGDRTEDEPTFGQVNIKAHEHAVIIPVSRVLLEDSFIDLQAFLADRIAVQFAKAEATAFVSGDGTNKPTGLLNAPTDYDGVDAKQDGTDILDRLIDLYYDLPGEYAMRGTWAMNRRTMGVIRKAADSSDSRGTLWSDGLADGTPARFLGAPVAEFPGMDDLDANLSGDPDTYPVVFGDFSNYQVIDRVGLQILRDDYTGASKGTVKFHARRRVGGKVLLTEAFRVLTAVAAA